MSEEERLNRLLETVVWIAYVQRPGVIGTAQRLVGHDASGSECELRRVGDEWLYLDASGKEQSVSGPDDLFPLLSETGFLPDSVVVVPVVAPLLFQGAMEELDRAQGAWEEAMRMAISLLPADQREKIVKPPLIERLGLLSVGEPFDHVMANSALDRCLRNSMASISLAIGAADAQVNAWLLEKDLWSRTRASKPFMDKVKRLGEAMSTTISEDAEPFKTVRERLQLRNNLLHGNPIEETWPLQPRAAGRYMILEARRTAASVRATLLELAGILKTEKPAYLAYCPPGAPEDEDVWRGGAVMTGLREDPDFPKVSDRHTESGGSGK